MSAISGFSAASAPTASNAFDAITSEDFVKIMFSELSNQDPLQPNDTKDLLQQIGLIRSIQSDTTLTKRLNQIADRNEFASASTLLGSLVTGLTAEGLAAEGVVGSVSLSDQGPILNLLNSQRIPFNNVQEFIDPSIFDNTTSPGAREQSIAQSSLGA